MGALAHLNLNSSTNRDVGHATQWPSVSPVHGQLEQPLALVFQPQPHPQPPSLTAWPRAPSCCRWINEKNCECWQLAIRKCAILEKPRPSPHPDNALYISSRGLYNYVKHLKNPTVICCAENICDYWRLHPTLGSSLPAVSSIINVHLWLLNSHSSPSLSSGPCQAGSKCSACNVPEAF